LHECVCVCVHSSKPQKHLLQTFRLLPPLLLLPFGNLWAVLKCSSLHLNDAGIRIHLHNAIIIQFHSTFPFHQRYFSYQSNYFRLSYDCFTECHRFPATQDFVLTATNIRFRRNYARVLSQQLASIVILTYWGDNPKGNFSGINMRRELFALQLSNN